MPAALCDLRQCHTVLSPPGLPMAVWPEPHPGLARGRDPHKWQRSHRWRKQVRQRYDATMVYGHDLPTLEHLKVHDGSFD